MASPSARLSLSAASLSVLASLLALQGAMAGETAAGFLAADPSAEKMGTEARAAFALAKKLASATLILPSGDGAFVDPGGKPVALKRFRVLWHHQGDSTDQKTAIYHARSLEALRRYANAGGGLLLSGAALAMVHPLGIDSARPRLGNPGRDRYVAQLLPVETSHPILAGLAALGVALDPSVGGNPRASGVAVTDAGYPAYADFLGSGGPHRGMVLARAASGAENPLVEYEVGKGRVIVMGWRLPHYAHSPNAHRANLERLTANILTYLGTASQWRKVVVKAAPPPKPTATPAVSVDQWRALDMAVRDLIATFGERYPKGPEHLARLQALRRARDALADEGKPGAKLAKLTADFRSLRREALLANPLLSFDRLLVVRRSPRHMGLPANWQSNSSLPRKGFDNDIAVLSDLRGAGTLTSLYKPKGGAFVGDVDLHFDADRLLFSSIGTGGRWQVLEIRVDPSTGLRAGGTGLRELPLITQPDVDNYDACYLPDGRIVFSSTAPFVGVPCVYGGSHVTNLYLLGTDGSIRQLTADQDHDWCPTVANDGRVLYLRWEYTDIPHSNSRRLFLMDPDGTAQMACYGTNSYFPNSFFYARPIPGHPTQVVGIATGHHGVARLGRLLILDPARGRREADGVVQEIPGWGKTVEPIIYDALVNGVWPQFLHPYPLSDKHFVVAARPHGRAPWGIYLVDVFDNMLLLKEQAGTALLEPLPLRTTARPPAIADKVNTSRTDAVVYLSDIYEGAGLEGIPRGTVKKLRLFTYHFSYQGVGGLLGSIGMDGPWDIKRVLGTVPVEPDGSAAFRVPACTPIAVQPLDERGQALQLMRSWFTAMPGEVLSCVGCHERTNTGPPNLQPLAIRRPPSDIQPWHGPVRGFAFHREVQPVLDRHCVRCHNGSASLTTGGEPRPDGRQIPDLRGTEIVQDWQSKIAGHVNAKVGGKFSVAYVALHRFVRRPGIESNIRLLTPMEYSANTTELAQKLRKGHHGVQLDADAWDRLYTWIDLNAPYHGTWTEIAGAGRVARQRDRRRAMSKLYAGIDVDPEAIVPTSYKPPAEGSRQSAVGSRQEKAVAPECPGWPFHAAEATRRQAALGPARRTIDLGSGITLELVRIPAGEFVMGDPEGHQDERPLTRVKVSGFWMGRCEITNEQFAVFDPRHDSRVESMHGYQFGIHGYRVNKPRQPAVRLSWHQARAFCRWLGERTGERVELPTEAQWEYACRAGTATPLWYGGLDTDFAPFANLGDAKLREFALDTYIRVRLVASPNQYDDWVPKDARFNDGGFVSVEAGRYRANPWGLHDMHGNVWEWTRTALRPYPYRDGDGRSAPSAPGDKVVRGGSWYDRPMRCRSAFRLAYPPYQCVFNVGFRVVLGPAATTASAPSHPSAEGGGLR